MTLKQLEQELAACGFEYVRRAQDAHRLYRNGAGRFVVVAPLHGRRDQGGQPALLTPAVLEAICADVQRGVYPKVAAGRAEVPNSR